MEENDIVGLLHGKTEAVNKSLKIFIDSNIQTFSFHDLNLNGKRRKLWTAIFNRLENPCESACHKHCLTCIRILSRDKAELNELVCDKWLDILLHHAGLVSQEEALKKSTSPVVDYAVVLEALKCLCNVVFNSTTAQVISAQNHSVEGIVMRLRTYRDCELPQEIKFFDMKLLFLITALSAQVRPRLKEQLHGLTYLMETLDLILKEAGGEERGASSVDIHITLSDDHISLAAEVLKVLFNLTVRTCEVDVEGDAQCLRLVSILHDLLLCCAVTPAKQADLRAHTVNLLMSLPPACYEELSAPLPPNAAPPPQRGREVEFEGRNMEAVAVLLEVLEAKLDVVTESIKCQLENLTPILTVLLGCARSHRPLRKWLRAQILPPLSEMLARPEEGAALRNRLCRLLTSPVTPVRDLAADLMFVLCKENVLRMVKYTGYGNAAGLLANRGLMLGGSCPSTNFSSDSEDSDTEEYKKYRAQINPVTGCVEPPHESPTAAMSDEQKEYEAMKLVNMMDRLARDGIVQPCRIGQDGRPEPVDHVLQMIENVAPNRKHDE